MRASLLVYVFYSIMAVSVLQPEPSGSYCRKVSDKWERLARSAGETHRSHADLTLERNLTQQHLSKTLICTFIIVRVIGQVARPYLQILAVWRDGGAFTYAWAAECRCIFFCRHYRGCSPFTAHGVRTAQNSNSVPSEVWWALDAARALRSGSTGMNCLWELVM